jgi:DNA-binding CsgD family transcriptional regulator
MVLVDAALGVHGMNPAALRLIGAVRGLSIETERLHLSTSGAGAALAEAIAACSEGRMDRGGASILFDRTDRELGLVAHVLPLAQPHDAARRQSIAALFLTDPAQPSRPPLDDFVRRYGLTPSETRVLMGIVDGRSPRTIAAAQGVGLPTVRTHLSRLYDKTGTTGQTDIVRLVTSLTRTL